MGSIPERYVYIYIYIKKKEKCWVCSCWLDALSVYYVSLPFFPINCHHTYVRVMYSLLPSVSVRRTKRHSFNGSRVLFRKNPRAFFFFFCIPPDLQRHLTLSFLSFLQPPFAPPPPFLFYSLFSRLLSRQHAILLSLSLPCLNNRKSASK